MLLLSSSGDVPDCYIEDGAVQGAGQFENMNHKKAQIAVPAFVGTA